MGQCAVSVSGISGIQRMIYTATHGFVPSVVVVTCRPQVITNSRVTVAWTDGVNSVTLTNCLIRHMGTRKSKGGATLMVLQIQDRRWKWNFAGALGQWNVKRDDGTIEPETQISARQLVARLFSDGMGETVDCTAIPDNDYPQVEWKGEKARVACARLLETYGCDIAFDVGTDSFVVVRLGSGDELPTSKVMSFGLGASFNPWPDQIAIWSGPIIVETKFRVRAVGLDTDGKIKPIGELSYTPTGGWPGGDPMNLLATTSDPQAHGLANMTVGRWFQIVEPVGGGWPGGITLVDIEHALPLRKTRLATYATDIGEVFECPPLLEGVFLSMTQDGPPMQLVNSDPWTKVDSRFRVNGEDGVIEVESPLWKLADDGISYEEPELYLTISHYIRDEFSQFGRYYLYRTLDTNGTPVEQRTREQYWLTLRGVYTEGTLDSTVDNLSTLEAEMNQELDEWAASYTLRNATTAWYGGVQYITLGGKIQVVQWIVAHQGGARTMASQNTEYMLGTKPRIMRAREYESEPIQYSSGHRRRRMRGKRN